MAHFNYSGSVFPIREDLKRAYKKYWQELAKPGCWWLGAESIAIAQETRNAVDCSYCSERKQALSAYQMNGNHDGGISSEYVVSGLDEWTVDAIHRVVTDQSRITQAYIDGLDSVGLNVEKYVELVGVAVTVFSIDEFNRALGLPLELLPKAIPGGVSGYFPSQAMIDIGFVPMLPSDGAVDKEADLWTGWAPNVVRALSVVPDAVRSWIDVSAAQYLSMGDLVRLKEDESRAIDRPQMELVAGRVSAINECFY